MTNKRMSALVPPNNDPGLSLLDYISTDSELSRKNEHSRIQQYENWLRATHQHLLYADLRQYLQYLLTERNLKPSSANAHLNSIRGRYRRMMKSDAYRNALSLLAEALAQQRGIDITSLADQMALVGELERRIENRIFAEDIRAKELTRQDRSDEEQGLRLTETQARMLLQMPDVHTLRGLRDAALIAIMICTGVREHEAVALEVDDLRQHYEGLVALRVKAGKGAKQRLVVYGNLQWCLNYVDTWLEKAQISTGAVFRGFWSHSIKIRPYGMNVRQVNRILEQYPIMLNGTLVVVKPHDLRRTYARIQFDSGMEPEALQQNMGHSSYDTTLGYIGNLSADKRASKSTMPMPHTLRDLLG